MVVVYVSVNFLELQVEMVQAPKSEVKLARNFMIELVDYASSLMLNVYLILFPVKYIPALITNAAHDR